MCHGDEENHTKNKENIVNGYSPVLSLVTGVVEIAAAVWAFKSRGRRSILIPTGLILLFLAGYQFAEIVVCANPGSILAARLAFFNILWLPAFSIWLLFQLIRPQKQWIRIVAIGYFGVAVVLAVWIFLDSSFVTKTVCSVVIARYDNPTLLYNFYCVYYQIGLAGILFGSAAGMAYTADPVLRKHMADLQAGTLGFILPSMLVLVSMSESQGKMSSVMCHFALVLAIFLVILIARERRTAT